MRINPEKNSPSGDEFLNSTVKVVSWEIIYHMCIK